MISTLPSHKPHVRMVALSLLPLLLSCASPPAGDPGEGKQALQRFERCSLPEGGHVETLIVAESEEEAGVETEVFEELSIDAARAELSRQIVEQGGVPLSSFSIRCEETEAPDGDVDFELFVSLGATGTAVRAVVIDAEAGVMKASSGANSRCASTVIGRTYCADAAQGSAILDGMGRVRCARGGCIQDRRDHWFCSRRSGGEAWVDARGVAECDFGCYRPTTTQCKQL